VSQDNALISKPLIRPTPCSHLFRNYVLYDNWADLIYNNRVGVAANGFRYQDWTVVSGTWTAAAGYLSSNGAGATNQFITTPCRQTVGTWEATVRIMAFDALNAGVRFHMLYTNVNNSYAAQLYAHPVTPTVDLYLINGGAWSAIISAAWVRDNAPHVLKVTRDAAGNFELFLDGVSQGVANDVTHTTSTSVACSTYDGAVERRWDDIKVYR